MNWVVKSALAGVVNALVVGASIHHTTYTQGPEGWFVSRQDYRASVTNHVLFPSAGIAGLGGFLISAVLLQSKGKSKEDEENAVFSQVLNTALAEGKLSPQVVADVREGLEIEV